jgi:hypothetical protein
MIDDWLANRDSLGLGTDAESRSEQREGYEKVVEVYCLHVLPRLDEWDHAKGFLDSEVEMTVTKRQVRTRFFQDEDRFDRFIPGACGNSGCAPCAVLASSEPTPQPVAQLGHLGFRQFWRSHASGHFSCAIERLVTHGSS